MEDEKTTRDGLMKELKELRRQVAEKRESEKRFRAIADYTADWENWVGTDGELLWVNPMVFDFTGYSVEECLAMADFPIPIIDETDRERMRRHFKDAVRGTRGRNVEFRIICKDGSLKWAAVSWQPIYDDGKVNLGHRSSIHDITARKQAEAELRESRHLQSSILLAAPIGIGLVSNRIIKGANLKLCEMTGYSSGELIDRSARMLYPTEEEYAYVGKEKYDQISLWGTGSVETRWLRKDGRILHILLSSAPLDPGNLGTGVTFAALDITAHKQAEAELTRYRENLEMMVRDRTAELENKTRTLEDLNTTLKILLRQREDDKKDLEMRILSHIRQRVLPCLEKLQSSPLNRTQAGYVDAIESNLHGITSPFLQTLAALHMNLTPREIEVADLVRDGKTTKEIAQRLNSAPSSINFHKYNIRKKMGLTGKKVNLRLHLMSLSQGDFS